MMLMDALAEARIREAQQRGELEGLPGAGEPLLLDDLSLVPENLRPAWLLTGFNSVLGALALFQPFTDFVGGMFSVTGIVYYLSVAGLFLFLTGQALERRRWN